jgi:hypothetical protein
MAVRVVGVALLAFVTMVGQAVAADVDLGTRPGIELGGQAFYYEYKEPGVAQEIGPKIGVTGSGTLVLPRSVFLRAEGRFALGPVDYSGSGTKTNDTNELWEIRGIVGQDLGFDRFVLAPFTGLGYRHLYDDLRGLTSTGAAGYRRDSQYFYVPLGASARFPFDDAARLSVTAEYDLFLAGRQKTQLCDVSAAYCSAFGTINNKQDVGYGARLAVAYETAHWSVGPFVNYWNIGDSDVVVRSGTGWFEPHNWTVEAGLQAAYRF